MVNRSLFLFIICFTNFLYGQSDKAVARFLELTQSSRTLYYLGYNPCIHYIPCPTRNNHKISVYLHGWKENKQSNLKRSLFTTPAIIFDFPDAKKDDIISLRQASFGQSADIMPTIFVLNAIVESGIAHEINLVGFSRGGATAVNTIATLNNPGSYRNLLKKMGIDGIRRQEILGALEHGIIVLDCPLKEVRYGILRQVQKYRSNLINFPQDCCQNNEQISWARWVWNRSIDTVITGFDFLLSNVIHYAVFPLYTDYAPWREQAINTISLWPIRRITTIIRYDQCDQMVTNHGDIAFYEKIHSLNRSRTFLVMSNRCGHCAHCQDLVNLFHILNQQPDYPQSTSGILTLINQENSDCLL